MQSLGPAAKQRKGKGEENPPYFCRALIYLLQLDHSYLKHLVVLCSFVTESIPHSTALSELHCCLFYWFGTGFQTRHCGLNEVTRSEHSDLLLGFSVEMQTLQHLVVP